MQTKRSLYFWVTLFILVFGILSRKINQIPLFVGDILYACLIYFGLRVLFPNFKIANTTLLALLFCIAIEFLQLYQATWMINIRNTALGQYVLGQGFLWTDLICYTIGVIISSLVDIKTTTKTQNS